MTIDENWEPLEDWDSELTSRIGVHKTAIFFHQQFGWLFREVHESDRGIDAYAEALHIQNGRLKMVALQIKTGASYFRKHGDDYVYYGKMRHLEYWMAHPLPVFLILCDPDKDLLLWVRIERHMCRFHKVHWSIIVPAKNRLENTLQRELESTEPSEPSEVLRANFRLDDELIEYSADGGTYFLWEEWKGQPPAFRNLKVYFDGIEETSDVSIDYSIDTDDLHLIMTRLFPWATYTYDRPLLEIDDGIVFHVLKVKSRPAAIAYLEAEAFLKNGYPDDTPAVPPKGRNLWAEGEFEALMTERAKDSEPHKQAK